MNTRSPTHTRVNSKNHTSNKCQSNSVTLPHDVSITINQKIIKASRKSSLTSWAPNWIITIYQFCIACPNLIRFRSFRRRSEVWIIRLQWNRNKVFVLPSEIIHPSSSNITQVSGHSVNFDVILWVDSSYNSRIPKRSTTGCGWLDPNFITNTKFAINAVVRLVILRFIVQKRIKPFMVKKLTRRNNALITPGCDVVPKQAVFDAPAGSCGHPFDCSMITFHYPIATWFISKSEN